MAALVKTTYTREGELMSEEIVGYIDDAYEYEALAKIILPLIKKDKPSQGEYA